MNRMEPLTFLAWAGVIALTVIFDAIAILVVWTVAQTIRGKSAIPTKSGSTVIQSWQNPSTPDRT